MADVFTPQKRSEIMSKIKGKNTQLEVNGFEILKLAGFRFRKHSNSIFGHPDATNKKRKIAVFFDSNFWHGYKYKSDFHKVLPNEYWHKKIQANIKRDRLVNKILRAQGWTVIRLWEHEIIKQKNKSIKYIKKLVMELES